MEAKVLRAALSAAIRVTVSTTLVGCGGATIGDPQSDVPAQAKPRPEPSPPVPSSGGQPASHPSTSPAPSNHAGSQSMATAGVPAATGGAAAGSEGGAPSAEGGAPPATPTTFCDSPAMQTCEPVLDELAANPVDWTEMLEPLQLGCCKTLVDALDGVTPVELEPACRDELDRRLNAARLSCCNSLGFPGNACAPWGPPVPPELELDQLLAWGAAA